MYWAFPLKDEARVAHLVEGKTFTFGKGRGGTIARLQEWSAGTGVGIHVVPSVAQPLLDLQIVPVSSSLIRFLIDGGRARDAAILLGRPYLLEGTVVPGHQRGRTIGAPTANLDVGAQLVPADGVYAARCTLDGATYAVALSIGTMPTFGNNERQIEAFLLGYDGVLYGRTLRVEVLDWLREQWKFSGADALRVQIAKDVDVVRNVVDDLDPARPIAVSA
jgi:riboflavin kinase/FMN adenylyltransferase